MMDSDGPCSTCCTFCRRPKLHYEFPTISFDCEHLSSWCMACLLQHLPKDLFGIHYHCPECSCRVDKDDRDLIADFCSTLVCPVLHDLDNIDRRKHEAETTASFTKSSGSIDVALLDGELCRLAVSSEQTLGEIKRYLSSRLGVKVSQQRLMYSSQELQPDTLKWRDAKVSYGSVLQLVVVMYEARVSSGPPGRGHLQALDFELSWVAHRKVTKTGKPTIDHLNGSCFVMTSDTTVLTSVDFLNLNWGPIRHHGPSRMQSARQRITVAMASLSSDVMYLFFTLSAFAVGGITLANFENPKVELRDSTSKTVLADYTASRASQDEAIILCCAKRDDANGTWRVQRIGQTSSGCVKNSGKLVSRMRQIVRDGGLL